MTAALNVQDLDYMRNAVIYAHVAQTPRRAVEVVAQYTDEEYRDRKSNDPVRQRNIEMARASTRVKGTETRPKKKSSMPLPPWAFDNARLIRAISKLPEIHQNWLRYAYADSREWDDEQGVVVQLWEVFQPSLGRAQGKTLQRAKGLTHLAVQDHKDQKNSGQARSAWHVRELLGVREPNWDQHWCGRWQRLHELLDILDQQALSALWELTEEAVDVSE